MVVHNLQVEGRRPRRRPRKSLMNAIQEDMMRLGINEDRTSDRHGWREAINRLTPQTENQRR